MEQQKPPLNTQNKLSVSAHSDRRPREARGGVTGRVLGHPCSLSLCKLLMGAELLLTPLLLLRESASPYRTHAETVGKSQDRVTSAT